MADKVWVESYSKMFPDFLACLNNTYDRQGKYIPGVTKIFIPVKELINRMRDEGVLEWNDFAGERFFDEDMRTDQFDNVAAFTVSYNGKQCSVGDFRRAWEARAQELANNLV